MAINCAGIVSGKAFVDLTRNDYERTIRVNVLGTINVTKALLPGMLDSTLPCHIVNIASVLGSVGVSHMTDYCASKFAVVGFHQALTQEISDSYSPCIFF